MDIQFNSLEELYNRLKPALSAKETEMHRLGFKYMTSNDVWNYLREIKWKSSSDLKLYQMVSDVLNSSEFEVETYLKTKLNNKNRNIYFD